MGDFDFFFWYLLAAIICCELYKRRFFLRLCSGISVHVAYVICVGIINSCDVQLMNHAFFWFWGGVGLGLVLGFLSVSLKSCG